jgi:competence protein ComGC
MKFYKKKNTGFTLMDILISTAIISLLSSLFLFRVSEAKKKAEDGQMKAEAHEVSSAVALYRSDNNGRAPLSTSGTTGVIHAESDPSSDYLPTMQMLVQEGYLAQVPTSPDGMSYYYSVSDDYEDAVFLVRLNQDSSFNSSTNSCPLTEEISQQQTLTQYPTDTVYEFQGCYESESVCTPGQINNGQSCFVVNDSTIWNPCSCSGSSGIDICYAYMNLVPGDGCYPDTGTQYFICNHQNVDPIVSGDPIDESVPLCNGTSDLDYCECI